MVTIHVMVVACVICLVVGLGIGLNVLGHLKKKRQKAREAAIAKGRHILKCLQDPKVVEDMVFGIDDSPWGCFDTRHIRLDDLLSELDTTRVEIEKLVGKAVAESLLRRTIKEIREAKREQSLDFLLISVLPPLLEKTRKTMADIGLDNLEGIRRNCRQREARRIADKIVGLMRDVNGLNELMRALLEKDETLLKSLELTTRDREFLNTAMSHDII